MLGLPPNNLHSHGFDSNFPRSSSSFSKCLMSSKSLVAGGIVLGSWDTTVNKIDKAPILNELAFSKEGVLIISTMMYYT